MFYLINTPWWLKKVFPGCTFNLPDGSENDEKWLYLTFDDGPEPEATPFVLDTLRDFGARATFFCIGKNVVRYPELYARVLEEGHAVGNHSFDHLNGWKTPGKIYLENVEKAHEHIQSALFRPPYGRITAFQTNLLKNLRKPTLQKGFNIIMWNVLSGDFDEKLTGLQCVENVLRYTKPGSVVVFHDSKKAYSRLQIALPKVLQYYQEKGYRFRSIPEEIG